MKIKEYLNKNRSNTKIALLVGLVLVNLLMAVKLIDFKSQLIDKKLDLKVYSRDISKLDKLVSDTDNEQTKLEKVLYTLPKTYFEVGALTYKIEGVARSAGLATEITYDREANTKEGFTTVVVKINTKGGYQNYKNFVSALSNLPYNVSIEHSIFENNKGTLEQTTVLKIFLQISN
jgi:Tfp pilus assembly protein PilO